jgi:sodium/proline symporter
MMSTADSQLLVTTSAVSEDVYHQSIHPKASQGHLVLVSRLVTLALGVAAIGLAQLPRSIFDKVLFAWGGLGAAFGPALVLSLWWKGTTRSGVLAGMLVGFLTIILWDNLPSISFARSLAPEVVRFVSGLYSLVPGFLAALLAVILVSRITSRTSPHPR